MGTITKVKNPPNPPEVKPASELSPTENKTLKQKKKMNFLDSIGSKLTAVVVAVGLVASPVQKENIDPHENMTLAQEGDSYLKKAVQLSEINPSRNSVTADFYEIHNRIVEMRQTYPEKVSLFAMAKAVGNTCLKYSLGNCLELSCAGWVYLQTQNLGKKVDIFRIRNKDPKNEIGGDHGFIVIGRDVKSDPKNPATWGPHAVIWDPLRNSYFYPTQLHLLLDYIKMDDQHKPISKPFDPATQDLALYASNTYTSQDIIDLCDGLENLTVTEQSELTILETCLNGLHTATDRQKTKEMSLSLIKWLGTSLEDHPTPLFVMAKQSLIDQLNSTLS